MTTSAGGAACAGCVTRWGVAQATRLRCSVAAQPRQPVDVPGGVAPQLLQHARTLHERAEVELLGHAHAAVPLHRFLRRLASCCRSSTAPGRTRARACPAPAAVLARPTGRRRRIRAASVARSSRARRCAAATRAARRTVERRVAPAPAPVVFARAAPRASRSGSWLAARRALRRESLRGWVWSSWFAAGCRQSGASARRQAAALQSTASMPRRSRIARPMRCSVASSISRAAIGSSSSFSRCRCCS